MLGTRVWMDRLSRSWLKVETESEHSEIDFAPRLRIVRNNGWVSLELLLVNDASTMAWVEEAMVVLTDLDATWQTSVSTGQARHEIRQNVRANETLALSLARAIYDAAGRPQGAYSCLICVVVRYRLGDEWFEKALDACRVEMAALTVLGLRRSRWYDKKVRPKDRPANPRPRS
jgi:hypothetical protein